MNYTQTLDYLMNQLPMFQRVGAAAYKADLKNITQLCHLLGNPQKDLKCIHIAGTNGKGSVTHIIASVLIHTGFKVGIYTSPHYLDFRERIKIGNELIEKAFITDFVSKNIEVFKTVNASFFEITTALMFEYFKHQKVDFCVIETGLGGRLDSTNIIHPLLSVITNISFDHQQFLGNTLEAIASEKAGIIKAGITVLIGEKQAETTAVFVEKARRENAPLYFSNEIVEVQSLKAAKVHFTEKSTEANFLFQTDFTSVYQQKNLQTALAALFILKKNIPEISISTIESGIKNIAETTYFIGRWMQMQNNPLVILDSAHNEGGISNLLVQLTNIHFSRLHFVYGCVADKDITKILELLPRNADYYFTKPSVARGKDEKELAQAAALLNLKGNTFELPQTALQAAISAAQKEDLVLVAGSIFLVADVLKEFSNS